MHKINNDYYLFVIELLLVCFIIELAGYPASLRRKGGRERGREGWEGGREGREGGEGGEE